jgi:carbonic anhydrase
MNKIIPAVVFSLLLGACSQQDTSFNDDSNKIRGVLKNLVADNNQFVKDHSQEYFKAFFNGQNPRAVVVGCSDSRFHTHAIDKNPDNDLFIIRNIGNQYQNSKGSIMYAINHLNTPTLIIIGHDGCGAVTAATTGISALEPSIKKELTPLTLPVHNKNPSDSQIKDNVVFNVHHQVELAMNDFKQKIQQKKLDVLGAIYDFKNVYGKGYGALVFVSWNGEKDPLKIEKKVKSLGIEGMKIG